MSDRIISFDTCTIGHLLAPGPFGPQVEPIYTLAKQKKLVIVVSEIVAAECCKLKLSDDTEIEPEKAKKLINAFFGHSFIERHSVTFLEAELAAEYKLKYNFKTCDAIVAATAAIAGVEILVTTDGYPNRSKGKLLSVPQLKRPDGGKMLIRSPDQWDK